MLYRDSTGYPSVASWCHCQGCGLTQLLHNLNRRHQQASKGCAPDASAGSPHAASGLCPHSHVMPVHARALQVFEMLDEDIRERSEAALAAPKIVERQWRQVHVDLSLADDSPTALDRAE